MSFLVLGTAVAVSWGMIAHQADELAVSNRETLRTVCAERNDRDAAIVDALEGIARDAGIEDIEPIMDRVIGALTPRDCASLYP